MVPAPFRLHATLSTLRDVTCVPLGAYPTVVEPLELADVVPTFRGHAWVKREDRSGAEVGGNEVRKLEFLFARARALDASGVLTVGGIGSDRCVATAFYGPEAGLDVHLVLFEHDVTAATRRALRTICALGPSISLAPTRRTAVALASARSAASRIAGRRLYPIWPGGSSVRRTLGFVEAGLELADQISAGELEPPDAIFCAYSSGGTAAGLALGLQIAGRRPEVVAVRVYPAPLASATMLTNLARRTRTFLATRCEDDLPPFDDSTLRVEGGYLGVGYGAPTEAASAASGAAADMGLELEPTYTGKAFAAFLDAAGSARYRDRRLLFVHTYDARLTHRLGDEDLPPDLVPRRLRRFVCSA